MQAIRRGLAAGALLFGGAACGGGGDSAPSYCEVIADLDRDLGDLGDLDLTDADGATEFAQGWADVVAKLSRSAPKDLSEALVTVNDALDAVDDELRDGDIIALMSSDDGPDLIDDLDKRAVTNALTEIDDYTEEKCDTRLRAERSIEDLVAAAPEFSGVTPDIPDEPTDDTEPVITEAPEPETTPAPPSPPSTTRPPLVLPTNPQGTVAPPVTSPPTAPDDTLVREPTQEEAQALSTAIHDVWPVLTEEQATCVGTSMLRLFLFDDIVRMIDEEDSTIDGALFIGATLCEVDPDIFFA